MKPGAPRPADTRQETRKASELVRTYAPKGMPSANAVQAAKLRAEGLSVSEISARMGVSPKSVSRWCTEARAIERED